MGKSFGPWRPGDEGIAVVLPAGQQGEGDTAATRMVVADVMVVNRQRGRQGWSQQLSFEVSVAAWIRWQYRAGRQDVGLPLEMHVTTMWGRCVSICPFCICAARKVIWSKHSLAGGVGCGHW